jgi:hypothetical protein
MIPDDAIIVRLVSAYGSNEPSEFIDENNKVYLAVLPAGDHVVGDEFALTTDDIYVLS